MIRTLGTRRDTILRLLFCLMGLLLSSIGCLSQPSSNSIDTQTLAKRIEEGLLDSTSCSYLYHGDEEKLLTKAERNEVIDWLQDMLSSPGNTRFEMGEGHKCDHDVVIIFSADEAESKWVLSVGAYSFNNLIVEITPNEELGIEPLSLKATPEIYERLRTLRFKKRGVEQ